MRAFPAFVSSALILTVLPVLAQQMALAPGPFDCGTDEPDSIEISWDAPCEAGSWIFEPGVGCRMADWHPDPQDRVSWSGSCRAALREGAGVAQWTEHREPIDRFEGTYANDLPNGFGTVTISGISLSGEWRDGCLKSGDRSVAIGVPRADCEEAPEYVGETAHLPPD